MQGRSPPEHATRTHHESAVTPAQRHRYKPDVRFIVDPSASVPGDSCSWKQLPRWISDIRNDVVRRRFVVRRWISLCHKDVARTLRPDRDTPTVRPAGRKSGSGQIRGRGNDLRWRLHELDQDTLATPRGVVVALRVDEADVVARGTLADPSRREPHALLGQPATQRQDRRSTARCGSASVRAPSVIVRDRAAASGRSPPHGVRRRAAGCPRRRSRTR